MTKKKYRTCSVNIETKLMEQIYSLQESVLSKLTISNIVNSALLEFFNFNSEYGAFINAAKGEILIPKKKYGTLFGIEQVSINNKIKNNQLVVIKIGDLEYIRLAEDDFKNVFAQVHKLRETVSMLDKKVEEISQKIK